MRLAAYCVTSILFLAPIVQAQGQGTLYGTVVDKDGTPVPRLAFSILGPMGTIEMVTGIVGQYQVSGLVAGDYTFTIVDSAYELVSEKRTHLAAGEQRFNLIVAPVEGRGSGALFGNVHLPSGAPAPSIVLTVVGPNRSV